MAVSESDFDPERTAMEIQAARDAEERDALDHLDALLDDATLERAGVALVNADAQEPYDRTDGRWRPAVLAEAVIRAALSR